eukprot:9269674-Ditylum_brightwellii.AAC.1
MVRMSQPTIQMKVTEMMTTANEPQQANCPVSDDSNGNDGQHALYVTNGANGVCNGNSIDPTAGVIDSTTTGVPTETDI